MIFTSIILIVLYSKSKDFINTQNNLKDSLESVFEFQHILFLTVNEMNEVKLLEKGILDSNREVYFVNKNISIFEYHLSIVKDHIGELFPILKAFMDSIKKEDISFIIDLMAIQFNIPGPNSFEIAFAKFIEKAIDTTSYSFGNIYSSQEFLWIEENGFNEYTLKITELENLFLV